VASVYANENVPRQVVAELRRLGHDVLTVAEAGKAGQAEPDEAVLQYACANCRVLLTLNRKHFVGLHNAKPDHRGIVVCSEDRDYVGLASRIHSELTDHSDLSGRLCRVDRPEP